MIKVLEEQTDLQSLKVRRELKGRVTGESKTRYAWGSVSPYALGAALQSNAYLSHASGMFLQALTDQLPKTIYVNREQSVKPKAGTDMTQANINRAFKRPARRSTFVFVDERARYVLLSGKNTNRYGVEPTTTPTGEVVDATNLERTLIDIVVRPSYAGGPREVLAAYSSALPRISIGRLIDTLRALDHAYPYHQAVGFLLERAGWPATDLHDFEAMGLNWDFYLAHQMADPEYDSKWKLFYPQGL